MFLFLKYFGNIFPLFQILQFHFQRYTIDCFCNLFLTNSKKLFVSCQTVEIYSGIRLVRLRLIGRALSNNYKTRYVGSIVYNAINLKYTSQSVYIYLTKSLWIFFRWTYENYRNENRIDLEFHVTVDNCILFILEDS